jgi:hypothetical protein
MAQADNISVLQQWQSAWFGGTGVTDGSQQIGTNPPPTQTSTAPPVATTAAPATTFAPQAATTSSSTPDAYLNFGTSAYPEQSVLTVGNAQPWYDSPSVTQVYGGVPNAQQQQSFINGVMADVNKTFQASGLTGSNAVSLTTDPNAGALHTMSVVSGLSYAPNPNAIGITDVGNNGFSFIDKLNYASTPEDLEWAVAHNMAHELMHAFGVAVHHDQTGQYLDAASASWSLLTSPDASLSPAAVQDIIAHDIGRNGGVGSSGVGGEGLNIDGDEEILTPVPEPSTVALWGLAATALILHRRRRSQRRRAAA